MTTFDELEDRLYLTLEEGDFTNPNVRTVRLIFDGRVLSAVTFNVVQKKEYDG